MGWTFSADLPVYVQIVRRIRADILSGRYPANSPFPSVRQLAFEASVNPNTMQRALCELENEGLLVTHGTAGRVVTGDQTVLAAARRQATADALEELLRAAQALGISKAELLTFIEETKEWSV